MKTLFRLMDRGGTIWLDKSWQKKVGNSNQAGAGRTFKYLCQAKYLLELGSDRFQVTDLAKINLLQEIVKTRKPDGKLRLVIFDIPEKLKRNRNHFRRHLAEMGFKMQQQSVWVSQYPCEDLVSLVVKYHGLGKYVELIIGKLAIIR
nr:hypothetical protein [uncultured bacterium]